MAKSTIATRFWHTAPLIALFLALAAPAVRAHECSIDKTVAHVGEALRFTIWSEDFEDEPSDYSVTMLGDPGIARIATPLSFSSLKWGRWGILATGVGTTNFTFFWSYPPAAASGSCSFEVEIVGDADTRATQANYEKALAVFDPISSATGEFYFDEKIGLSFAGPFPLRFGLFYGSSLLNHQIYESRIGNNWLHTYDLSLLYDPTGGEVHIQFHKGRMLRFAENAGSWDLVSPLDTPFQLVESGGNFVLGDPWRHQIYTFDPEGRLLTIEDGKGNTQTLTYSGPRLDEVSDGLGRTLTFSYNSVNLISSVSDGTRSIAFSHSYSGANKNLATATDAAFNTTTYTHEFNNGAAGRMVMRHRSVGSVNSTQIYDSEGRVTSQTDGAGYVSTIAYAGTSTTTTDPQFQNQTHTYDGNGAIADIQDEDGNSITSAYDADGRRTSFTDRTSEVTSYTYHAGSGKVASATMPDGGVTTYGYTARILANGITFYDLTGIEHPDGETEVYVYDVQGNMTSATDRQGSTWTYTYDARGQLLTETNPIGGTTTTTYNADGTIADQETPASGVSTYAYDSLDRLSTTTLPGGATVSATYDDNDNVLTVTDEEGRTTARTYDGNNNVISVTDPGGFETTHGYDSMDRRQWTTHPGGESTSLSYNGFGKVETTTDGNYDVINYGYDSHGRLATVTSSLAEVVTFGYDEEGILTSVQSPLGDITTMTTDAMGRPESASTPLGHTRTVARDLLGRMTEYSDPLGATTSFAYGTEGLLASVTLPEGIGSSYLRNAIGQITSITDPRGFDWVSTYDAGQRRTSRTDPLGNTTTYEYDTTGRVTPITLPAGSLTLTYDDSGAVTSRVYSDGTTINYAYDTVGRLNSGTGMSRSFDANGSLIESNGIAVNRTPGRQIDTMQLAPAKVLDYTYDSPGRLTQVVDWDGASTSFVYDASGQLTGITRPNGVHTTYDYDADSNLISLTEGAIASATYVYDARGNLVNATRNFPLGVPVLPGEQTDLTFDAASQVASFTYDTLGQLVDDGARVNSWNLAGELTQTVDGLTTDFTYDALGHRLSQTQGAVERHYVWNYALAIPSPSVIRDAGADLNYYVHTPGGILLYSIDPSGNRLFYHYDENGNTVALTNDAGNVVASYAYTPFGELVNSSGAIENPFTWQGRIGVMDDGNGLYYMRAREYDSATARFLSRDPDLSVGPRNLNRYMYALNDPIRYTESRGTSPEDIDYSCSMMEPKSEFAWSVSWRAIENCHLLSIADQYDLETPKTGRGLLNVGLAAYTSLPGGPADADETCGLFRNSCSCGRCDVHRAFDEPSQLEDFDLIGSYDMELWGGQGHITYYTARIARQAGKEAFAKVSINLPVFGLGSFSWLRIPVGDGSHPYGTYFNPRGFVFDGEGLLVKPGAPIISDGFESGDTSSWSF